MRLLGCCTAHHMANCSTLCNPGVGRLTSRVRPKAPALDVGPGPWEHSNPSCTPTAPPRHTNRQPARQAEQEEAEGTEGVSRPSTQHYTVVVVQPGGS